MANCVVSLQFCLLYNHLSRVANIAHIDFILPDIDRVHPLSISCAQTATSSENGNVTIGTD